MSLDNYRAFRKAQVTTLIQLTSTIYGATALAVILACGGLLFFRRWRKQRVEKLRLAAKAELLCQLEKQEKTGLQFFKAKNYSLAEYHFSAAAAKAGKLGNRQRQLQNRHKALIAMSRNGCERALAACKQLKQLVEEMTSELPASDKLLELARTNLAKLEEAGLRKAAEDDFARAGQSFESGNMHEANRLYAQSYRVAREYASPVLCASILNEHSRVFAKNGKIDEAVRTLETALTIARANCPAEDGLPSLIEWNLGYYRIIHDEKAVQELLKQTNAAYKRHEFEQALELANEAVSTALANLRVDHWVTADALNYRAGVRMSQGFYSEARCDLDEALLILSEWPEQAAQIAERIESNLEKCRRDMGY